MDIFFKNKFKAVKTLAILLTLVAVVSLSSCGNSSSKSSKIYERIVATSPATAEILDKLGVENVVGVAESKIYNLPERYKDVKKIGGPMAPDIEIIRDLKADLVIGPKSLQGELEAKYDNAGIESKFLNLSTVEGLYDSVEELGKLLGKEKEAKILIDEYEKKISDIKDGIKGKKKPRVLVLMGVPGSYLVATENSYVGNLVKLAGGENVYGDGKGEEFLKVNTEDMVQKDVDIILRAAHGVPEQVKESFKKEFENNDIWKHFEAVKNNKVYDLQSGIFGMSASFQYQDALTELDKLLFN